MNSSPAGYSSNARCAHQVVRFQPRADRPGLAVQFAIGQVDLLVLAVDQIGEGDVFRLAARAVQQKLHQIGGAEERTRQMIQMHDCSNSRCHQPSSATAAL